MITQLKHSFLKIFKWHRVKKIEEEPSRMT